MKKIDCIAARGASGNDPAAGTAAPGLYVHVPFCRAKCPYCDFYSVPENGGLGRWRSAVAREAELFRGLFSPFETLYLGGGTPSLACAAELARLLRDLRRVFAFTDDCEMTMEANPDDIEAEPLAAWRALGVNRLSIGVQSFEDEVLRRLRRRHDAARAERAIVLAREEGFENIGIDLMYGVPGQTVDSWRGTIEAALSFAPEHISCYQLTVDRHGESAGRRGRFAELSEPAARSFFLETAALLRSRGYYQYEVSNFARSPALVSRHNRKYWRHAPYLGLGPSAHSFRRSTRWWNVRSLAGYCEALEASRTPIAGSETLGARELDFESLFLGFRTADGVPLDTLRRYARWEGTLERLIGAELVRIEGGRAVPTVEGLCVADRLPLLFAS